MKAIVCNEWCKPEDLKILEVENPTLNSDSVRIEVVAAGVNFPDVLIIQGKYQYKPNFPFSPGSEVAGKVLEIGDNVNDIKVGDRVKRGDSIIVLEAMKMQHEILASIDGEVVEISCGVGDQVSLDDVLVNLK